MNHLEQTTDEPTNEERAGRIDMVMQTYCLTLEGRDFDCNEDDVKDVLADLMHFCERMEWDSISATMEMDGVSFREALLVLQ